MDGLVGSGSWQPLGQSSCVRRDVKVGSEAHHKAPCSNGLPSKREIFMSTLLTRLPTYALQLLSESNEGKLSCLARLSRDDLAAILAQPQPQLLLEAVYQQQQQTQDADTKRVSSSDGSIFGDLEDSPFTRNMLNHNNSSSTTLTEADLLPQPIRIQQRISSSGGAASAATKPHLLACHSSIIPGSPVCSPLAAAAAAQNWCCPSNSSSRRYRFRGSPVCSDCGLKGHIAEACFTPRCSTCQLWGHSADDCPNCQCWICGYFGHSFADCPDQQQQLQQSLSLVSSMTSQPESSVLLSCTSSTAFSSFNSCGSSNLPLTTANSILSVASNSDGRAYAYAVGAGSRASSSSSSSCQDVAHPGTPPTGTYIGGSLASAAAAPSDSNAAAEVAPLPPAPPPRPVPTAAAAASHAAKSASSSSSHKARKYMFGGHGRGPLVCCKCGAMGHIADKCRTPKCSKCSRYGHTNTTCDSACSKCGKDHDGPVGPQCTMKCCQNCGLWGHRPRNCPSSQCSNCGYYGHLAAQCMACPQCKRHGHTATKCPVTKLLGVGMYELIISE